MRDAVIDLLEREPLPLEPQTRLDASEHDRWRINVIETARRHQHGLQAILAEGGPRTSYLPAKFSREWLPADLLALQTLDALANPGREIQGLAARLLRGEQRAQLAAMLAAADLEVSVPNPEVPDGPALYEGPAPMPTTGFPPAFTTSPAWTDTVRCVWSWVMPRLETRSPRPRRSRRPNMTRRR